MKKLNYIKSIVDNSQIFITQYAPYIEDEIQIDRNEL